MQTVYTVLTLLLVVGATRLAAQLLPLPLPLIQIAAGALLALPSLGLHIALDPELFLFLFIPPLLFVDGWRIPKREVWRMRWPILMMAFGLVFFTVVGAGYFIHLLIPEIPLAASFALAAVLSPTDALAVSAITQGRLPKRLMHLLEGEALMNDASGLVAFKFAIAAAMTGVFSLVDASLNFLLVAVGGLAIGVFLSWSLGRIRAWMISRGWDDPATHVVLMLLLPFASYMVAEHLGVSGILSAVAAGMMQSWVDLLPRQTSTRLLNRSVWSMLEFAFNGVVFLLLGLQLPDIMKSVANHHGDLLWRSSLLLAYVAAITAVLMLIRYGWVYGYWKLSLRIDRWRGKSPPGLRHLPAPSLRPQCIERRAWCGDPGGGAVGTDEPDGWQRLPAARPDHLHRHQRDPDFPDRRDHRPAAAAARAAGEQQWRPRARAARGLAQDRGGGDPGPGERGIAAGGRQRCGEYFAGRRGACADHGRIPPVAGYRTDHR